MDNYNNQNNGYNNDNYNQNNQYNQQYNNQYNQQYNQPYQYPQYQEQPEQPGRGFAIASLVLGIVSCVCCGGILFSILGIIFGVISKQRQKENNGMATAGIVLSIITLVLGIVFTIIAISTGLLEAYSSSYSYLY